MQLLHSLDRRGKTSALHTARLIGVRFRDKQITTLGRVLLASLSAIVWKAAYSQRHDE